MSLAKVHVVQWPGPFVAILCDERGNERDTDFYFTGSNCKFTGEITEGKYFSVIYHSIQQ